MLNNNYNFNTVYVSCYPGAGGDDAKDWAGMLIKMYRRCAERKKWNVRLIDDGVIEIKGQKAYERLKEEAGVHRLVRVSPFDAKGLRHTSFALVEVLPEIKSETFSVPESEIKFDFFRAGGPGGQNVNKVETAVRVIHLPTGLKASAQTERSQSLNRTKALSLLKSKLAKVLEEKKIGALNDLRVKVAADWGNEIRSYVLHPYKMVKNHTTGQKNSQVEKVLDGDLDILAATP